MKIIVLSLGILFALNALSPKRKYPPQDMGQVDPFVPVMLALIKVESGGDIRARRLEPHLMAKRGWQAHEATSYGLTQVIYGWHKETCQLKSHTDLYDPITNIDCGAKILKDCIRIKGSLEEGLECYNRGPGAKPDPNKIYSKKVLNNIKG